MSCLQSPLDRLTQFVIPCYGARKMAFSSWALHGVYLSFSGTIYFTPGRKYPNVVFEGFEYKIRKTSATRNYFRCKREASSCRAKLETFGKCVLIKGRHNHSATYLDKVQQLHSVRVVTLRESVLIHQ
ncbi:hypothetical protein D910_12464 [Dendroctonus ponderosae]